MVDDFLFITPSRTAAEALVRRMQAGFPDFGCQVGVCATHCCNCYLHAMLKLLSAIVVSTTPSEMCVTHDCTPQTS